MTRLLKITALMLVLLMMAVALSSCDTVREAVLHLTSATERPRGIPEDNNSEYVDLSATDYTYSPYYTPIRPRHSYQLLTEGQRKLYDELYDSVREVYPATDEGEDLYKTRQVIIDKHLLSTADIRVVAKAIYDDHPDIFWLSSTIYQLTDEKDGYTAVQMRSIYSPDEIAKMQKELKDAANAFYSAAPDGMSEYEREKYVHDYICNQCEYDEEAAKTHTSADRIEEAYIVYGTMVLHKSVCEGYARTMQLLLGGLGVDCVGITGLGFDADGSEDLHMWNAVNLGGDWYYVDPTWDDQSINMRRYQYFNLSDAMLSQDHEKSRELSTLTEDEINGDETFSSVAMNIFVPECNTLNYNYYVFECPHLTDYDGNAVKERLYRAALDRAEQFTFYIDPDSLDYDEALDLLFRDHPQYFFSYADDVNGWLSEYEIDNSNMSYYSNEKRNAVTVVLKYY
ncbi:MAG: hypothetical protein IJS27_00650 [Ruminococcus sp.]|nr:hypothetical protein [Ruminococcus sp.]